MEFIDTQILSYKFKGNKELFDGNIHGRYISSVVALEFLGIMVKNENKASMYPARLRGFHPISVSGIKRRKKGFEPGKQMTDKLIIDFNGEFDSIVIFSNEAISNLINAREIDTLLMFASMSLEKEDYRKFRDRIQFLIDNEITVVPITKSVVNRMQRIYALIKEDYNVKDNYRNSFMDLLILSTAFEWGGMLITKDKELNKVIKKCCDHIEIIECFKGISSVFCTEKVEEHKVSNDHTGYVNQRIRIMGQKWNCTMIPGGMES